MKSQIANGWRIGRLCLAAALALWALFVGQVAEVAAAGEAPVEAKNLMRVIGSWVGAAGEVCYTPPGGMGFELSGDSLQDCLDWEELAKNLGKFVKSVGEASAGDAAENLLKAGTHPIDWFWYWLYVPTWYVEITPNRGHSHLGSVFGEVQNLALSVFETTSKYAVGPVMMAPFGGSALALDALDSSPLGLSARGRGALGDDTIGMEVHVWRLGPDVNGIRKMICDAAGGKTPSFEIPVEVWPAYYTELDWIAWNTGIPDYVELDGNGIPKGLKFWEMTNAGAKVNKLKGWGAKYPRRGQVQESNPRIAAAVLALRALSRMSSTPWKDALGDSAPGPTYERFDEWPPFSKPGVKKDWDIFEHENGFRLQEVIPAYSGCFKGGEEWYGWMPQNPLKPGFGFVVWEAKPICMTGEFMGCLSAITGGALENFLKSLPVVGWLSAYKDAIKKAEEAKKKLKDLEKYADKGKKVYKAAKVAVKVAAVAGAAYTGYKVYQDCCRPHEEGEEPPTYQGQSQASEQREAALNDPRRSPESALVSGCKCSGKSVTGCSPCLEGKILYCPMQERECPPAPQAGPGGASPSCFCVDAMSTVPECFCDQDGVLGCPKGCGGNGIPVCNAACTEPNVPVACSCVDRLMAPMLMADRFDPEKGAVSEETKNAIDKSLAKVRRIGTGQDAERELDESGSGKSRCWPRKKSGYGTDPKTLYDDTAKDQKRADVERDLGRKGETKASLTAEEVRRALEAADLAVDRGTTPSGGGNTMKEEFKQKSAAIEDCPSEK